MPHAWILDVLTDLRSYAEKNNLTAIAQAAAEVLVVAEAELSCPPGKDGNLPQD
jgi:hypothetical protein